MLSGAGRDVPVKFLLHVRQIIAGNVAGERLVPAHATEIIAVILAPVPYPLVRFSGLRLLPGAKWPYLFGGSVDS